MVYTYYTYITSIRLVVIVIVILTIERGVKIFLISYNIDFERFYYTKLFGMRPLSL